MQPRSGSGKAMAFQLRDDGSDAHSELDVDLYDVDAVVDGHDAYRLSLSGFASILNRDSVSVMTPMLQTVHVHATQPVIQEGLLCDAAGNVPTLQATTSSSGSSSSQRQLPTCQSANPNHPTIRTDFTTTGQVASMDDNFESLATPPGEPLRQEGLHPAYALPARTERSMRAEWLIGLVAIGIASGIVVSRHNPDSQVSYWLKTVGDLYVRVTACITLPLAFCQVVTSTAELVNNGTLRRAWFYTALYSGVTLVLSAWLGVLCAAALQSTFTWHAPQGYRIAYTKFAFKCADGTYIEQQPTGHVRCTGTSVNLNTTFPRMVDISRRLGLDDSVGNVNLSQYFFYLLEACMPVNIVDALARDNFLSVLVVALVLGVAVSQSFSCPSGEIKCSKNPLFHVFTQLYESLFVMNDWIQKLALWATVPLLIGAVLEVPNATTTLELARYYIFAVHCACFGQSLVVVPALFFLVTRQNPYRWIARMLAPMSYGMILSSAFYALPMATKAALRSNQVSPSVFGAVYPILSVVNRSQFALGVPSALLYCAAFSGCAVELTASNVLRLFALTCLGSLGDTMLPRTSMAFFLMTWRLFCQNEDTPSAVLMIATVGLLVVRLAAVVGIMTNMQLIRMVSFAVERDDRQRDSVLALRRPASPSAVSRASALCSPDDAAGDASVGPRGL